MAKQDGVVKIRGTVDDLTFSRTKNGSLVRKKTLPPSALEFQTSARYARLRENKNEFNQAIEAGKLLRTAVTDISSNTVDKKLSRRMVSLFKAVVTGDTHNKRGERTVVDGNLSLLKDFNFNPPSNLATALKASFTAAIDRVTGKMTVSIPSFVPEDGVVLSAGATHFMFHSLGLDINFGTGESLSRLFTSQGIPLGTDPTPAVSIIHDLTPNSTNPLLLLLGIRFYQEVNGVFYPLRNSANNALAIVEVSVI